MKRWRFQVAREVVCGRERKFEKSGCRCTFHTCSVLVPMGGQAGWKDGLVGHLGYCLHKYLPTGSWIPEDGLAGRRRAQVARPPNPRGWSEACGASSKTYQHIWQGVDDSMGPTYRKPLLNAKCSLAAV